MQEWIFIRCMPSNALLAVCVSAWTPLNARGRLSQLVAHVPTRPPTLHNHPTSTTHPRICLLLPLNMPCSPGPRLQDRITLQATPAQPQPPPHPSLPSSNKPCCPWGPAAAGPHHPAAIAHPNHPPKSKPGAMPRPRTRAPPCKCPPTPHPHPHPSPAGPHHPAAGGAGAGPGERQVPGAGRGRHRGRGGGARTGCVGCCCCFCFCASAASWAGGLGFGVKQRGQAGGGQAVAGLARAGRTSNGISAGLLGWQGAPVGLGACSLTSPPPPSSHTFPLPLPHTHPSRAGECLVNKQTPLNTRDPVPAPNAMPDTFYRPAPVMWKGYPGEKCVVDKVRACVLCCAVLWRACVVWRGV